MRRTNSMQRPCSRLWVGPLVVGKQGSSSGLDGMGVGSAAIGARKPRGHLKRTQLCRSALKIPLPTTHSNTLVSGRPSLLGAYLLVSQSLLVLPSAMYQSTLTVDASPCTPLWEGNLSQMADGRTHRCGIRRVGIRPA